MLGEKEKRYASESKRCQMMEMKNKIFTEKQNLVRTETWKACTFLLFHNKNNETMHIRKKFMGTAK